MVQSNQCSKKISMIRPIVMEILTIKVMIYPRNSLNSGQTSPNGENWPPGMLLFSCLGNGTQITIFFTNQLNKWVVCHFRTFTILLKHILRKIYFIVIISLRVYSTNYNLFSASPKVASTRKWHTCTFCPLTSSLLDKPISVAYQNNLWKTLSPYQSIVGQYLP